MSRNYFLYGFLISLFIIACFGCKQSEKLDQDVIVSEEHKDSKDSLRHNTGDGLIDPHLNDQELSTIRLFEESCPSVVFITTSNLRRSLGSRNVSEVTRGSGTGFVWDTEGHIVTNFHVIEGAGRHMVTLFNHQEYPAKVVGILPSKDLAVLKIDVQASDIMPIPRSMSSNLRVGQSVNAIGNPFGLDQTLTTGVISALGREIQSVIGTPIRDVIQIDAAINPGNSGGPLLNSSGELIGVNTAIYSPSGAFAGIGFSIPVDVVNWVVPDLIEYGVVRRPILGISVAPASIRARFEHQIKGVLVWDVSPKSGAAKAGIIPFTRNQMGDIIQGINEHVIDSSDDLLLTLEKYQPGDIVDVKINRNDVAVTLKVKLQSSF